MANSSKDEEVNAIDALFTVGSSPPADRHEELFHAENKGAMGTRVRVQTEKGKEYSVLRLTNAFISAKRSWRRQLNHLQCQVITQQDIPALQRDCEVLEERMRELFKAQEALEEVVESEDEIGKLDQNLEELARENNAILRQVGDRIKDLEAVLVERNSTRSTSTRKSNKSKRSNSSHKSGKSNISLAHRRIGLEEDIATLKATIALSQERQAITVGTSPLKIAQVRHLLCSAVSRANATHCKTMAASLSAEEAREKVLEDHDELESKDSDNESEEMEEDAFENNNFLAETLKHSLQRLGKDQVNGEFFINASVEILVPLYHLIGNHVPGITQATKILNSYPVYAGTIFYTESKLWLESIYRRLAGRRRVRNPFYAEVTRDIPHGIFSILLRMIKGIDGFCEPFVNFGRNKKAEVVSFTTLRPVKQLFSILSGKGEAEVVSYFKRTLTGKKCGSKVSVVASEEKDMAFMYKITKGQFVISYYFGEWNTHGFPQHN